MAEQPGDPGEETGVPAEEGAEARRQGAPATKTTAKKAGSVKKAAPAKKVASAKTAKKAGSAKKATSAKKAAHAKKTTSGRKAPAEKITPAGEPESGAGTSEEQPTPPAPVEPADLAPTDLAGRARRLVVRPEEGPWTPEELDGVYQELTGDVGRLEAELDSAADDIADLLRDSGDGAGDDEADTGSKTFEREHEISLANNTRDMLAQTRRALGRIDDGSYGVCEGCGEPIGKARLLAFPRATLCVSCKQREERR